MTAKNAMQRSYQHLKQQSKSNFFCSISKKKIATSIFETAILIQFINLKKLNFFSFQ